MYCNESFRGAKGSPTGHVNTIFLMLGSQEVEIWGLKHCPLLRILGSMSPGKMSSVTHTAPKYLENGRNEARREANLCSAPILPFSFMALRGGVGDTGLFPGDMLLRILSKGQCLKPHISTSCDPSVKKMVLT